MDNLCMAAEELPDPADRDQKNLRNHNHLLLLLRPLLLPIQFMQLADQKKN